MKTYDINVRVTVEGMSGKDVEAARFVAGVIRDKIAKPLNNDSFVKQWSVDLPNEVDVQESGR